MMERQFGEVWDRFLWHMAVKPGPKFNSQTMELQMGYLCGIAMAAGSSKWSLKAPERLSFGQFGGFILAKYT